MATKLARMVTFHEGIPPIKSCDPLITWYCVMTWLTKNIYTTTKPMTTEHDIITTKSMFIKLDSMVTYLEELLPIYNHMTL